MSYELYPELLKFPNPNPDGVQAVADVLDAAPDIKVGGKAIEQPSLKTFVLRTARGGLDNHEVAEIFRDRAAAGPLDTVSARLRVVEACCRAKARKLGASWWGAKCTQSFTSYLELWPEAFFINVVRDGRDVLASQQNTGSFTNSAAAVGRGWARNHTQFRNLALDATVHAYELCYERLVAEPDVEVRALASFLGVPFEPTMLSFHTQALTVFSASHLSMNRITKPIDQTQVGRWTRELSDKDLHSFEREAGEAMELLGYERATNG